MKTALLLVSAVAVTALTAGAQNTPQDDYPNFPPGAALPMMATGGGQASGRINGGDDLDCFSFSLNTARTATLYTTGNTDTRGTLRRMGNTAGNAGTVIATAEGEDGNFRIVRTLEPGFYSICVGGRLTPAADGTVTGAYTLVLELTGGGVNPPVGSPEIAAALGESDLPNNSTVNFGTLTLGSTQQVVREIVFSNRGDRDLRLGPVTIPATPMMGALLPSVVFRVLTQPAQVLAPGRTTVCRLGASAAFMNSAGIVPPAGPQTGVANTPNDDADENPFVLNLTAEIVRPDPPAPGDIKLMHGDAELAQGGTIDFGTTPAGQRVVKTVAVSNTGTGELRVTDITIHGASSPNDPNDPAIGNIGPDGAILPGGLWEGGTVPPFVIDGGRTFTLAPGASRNVHIVYAPHTGGTHTAEVAVRSNDPDENPYAFKVTGEAEAPLPPDPADIDVRLGEQPAPDGSTVEFGQAPLGTEVRKEFVVKNTGASPLNVRAAFAPTAAARGNDMPVAAAFRINGVPTFTVPPGGQRGVVVSFRPMTPGVFHALLVLSNNDPDENPWRLRLTGTGGAGNPDARPDIALSTGDADLPSGGRLDFGTVAPGQALTKEVTIANTGEGDLRLTRVSFARPDAPGPVIGANGLVAGDMPGSIGALHFRVVLPVNRVVPAGGRATMRVTFIAPSHGSQVVLLRLESNDPDESPYTVTLAGASSGETPAQPEIALSVGDRDLPMNGTLDFGQIVRGQRAVREIRVSNSGAGVLRIGGIAILPPEANSPTPAGGVNLLPGVFVTQVRVISGINTVAPGGSGIIRLEFRGLVMGKARYRARLYCNDADENPYRFDITGEVIAPKNPKDPEDPNDPAVNAAGGK